MSVCEGDHTKSASSSFKCLIMPILCYSTKQIISVCLVTLVLFVIQWHLQQICIKGHYVPLWISWFLCVHAFLSRLVSWNICLIQGQENLKVMSCNPTLVIPTCNAQHSHTRHACFSPTLERLCAACNLWLTPWMNRRIHMWMVHTCMSLDVTCTIATYNLCVHMYMYVLIMLHFCWLCYMYFLVFNRSGRIFEFTV